MRSMTILAGLALVLAAEQADGGETLSPEQALPLVENRDGYEPAAAWGGDVFLVAWKSGHLGEGDLREGLKYIGDLAACRVDKSGKVLDAQPLALSTAKDLQERPRIAFGGGVFLVVWQDLRNEKDWDVYAARVTPAGKLLDPDGVLVAGGAHNQALPDVAWDGKAFQVVWQDYRSGDRYEVYGARVSADGKVLDPQGKPLVSAKAPLSRYGPVTAAKAKAADGRSLVFWRGSPRQKQVGAGCLWVADCAPAGEPYVTGDGGAPYGGAHTNFPMCLAAGPDGFLGAWTTQNPGGRGNAANDAHAAVFSKDGKLEKKFLLLGEGGVGGARIRNPAAAWAGSRFVVAWDQRGGKTGENVFAAEVGADGGVSSPVPVSGTAAQPAIKPAVASDGAGTTLVAYEKHPEKTDTPIKIGFRMLAAK